MTIGSAADHKVPVRRGFLHSEDGALRRGGYHEWDRLRTETPVFESDYTTPGSPHPTWYFLEYDDVYTVLRDTALFSSVGFTHPDFESDYKMIPSEFDPPEHTRYRTLLNPFFSPARVAELEPTIRSVCRDLIDSLVGRGRCDVLADFALKFPTTVFMGVLGVPVDDLDLLVGWVHESQHTSHAEDPDGRIRDGADRAIHEFMAGIVEERRRQPTEDLISRLLDCRIEGRPLDDKELGGILYLLFLAGLDTVASMIGWSFFHLAGNEADRRRLGGDPSVVPSAVEELLRYYSIVSIARHLTADAELKGCPMHKGDRVFVPLATANRDPKAFPEAERFAIERSPNRHIGFGAGPHRCLGSHLARLELAVALEEWHRRIPEYSFPHGFEPQLRVGMFVTSLIAVPLEWASPTTSA